MMHTCLVYGQVQAPAVAKAEPCTTYQAVETLPAAAAASSGNLHAVCGVKKQLFDLEAVVKGAH